MLYLHTKARGKESYLKNKYEIYLQNLLPKYKYGKNIYEYKRKRNKRKRQKISSCNILIFFKSLLKFYT